MTKKKKLRMLYYRSIASIIILCVIFSSFHMNSFVEALTKDHLIESNVIYNDDHTEASIVFDLDSVAEDKYFIESITSEKEEKVIYDSNSFNQSTDYLVKENGTYDFTIAYSQIAFDERESDQNMKKMKITVPVKDIKKNETMDHTEISDMNSFDNNTGLKEDFGTTIDTTEETLEETFSNNSDADLDDTSQPDNILDETVDSVINTVNNHSQGAYPQEILLKGLGFYGNFNKAKFNIDPSTYKITGTVLETGTGYHSYFDGIYYRITVYKKDAKLYDTGEVVFEVKGTDRPNKSQFEKIEGFRFEEGDMIQIWSPESKFNFPGSPIIASDGVNTVDYTNGNIPSEKWSNSVYEITGQGLKEIYNEVPLIKGIDIPLFALYDQGDLSKGELQEAPVYTDIQFLDDRNDNGIYVRGKYQLDGSEVNMKYDVTNLPPEESKSGLWTSRYTITDSWGRSAQANRNIVKLPKFDNRIKIEEMENKVSDDKLVFGFVHFQDAKINPNTVNLPSGAVINTKPEWEANLVLPYGNDKRTRLIKSSSGDLEKIDVGERYYIPTENIVSVEVKRDSSTIIVTNYNASISETQIASFNEQELKKQLKEEIAQIMGVNISNLDGAEIVLDANLEKDNPKVGSYQVTLQFKNANGTIKQIFSLNVTENPWSYDTPERIETNGASGFVVIPKGIELERDIEDSSQLSAKAEVYFANYQNAENVQYNISVDRTFEMINVLDNTNKFVVTATSSNAHTNWNNNILDLGSLSLTNTKGNGLNIMFSASTKETERVKGRWQGNVHFYIERK
ncbi:hypothetical protein E1H99_11655 [Enterococcus hirae]|nr:hypothetical protein E1H99_11655 [Enterococcus hirae]